MTSPRRGRRIVIVVAPLAALAVAWTSHQTGAGITSADAPASPAPVVAPETPLSLPETSTAIEAPASLSGAVSAGRDTVGSASRVSADSTAAPGDIPAPALSAYQRAESIINAADSGCQVSWQLIAAIGSVESDHGRFGGSVLDDQGRATPAILGPVLDGGPGMATIRDTDAGQYDADKSYDRAVGPLQFIPSTWAVAGVDADDDGRRDPQDIDDASLAAAVYLCSGDEDLSTRAGQEAAVHRYNRSDAYVDLVLARAQSYLDGDVVGGGGGGYTTVVNAGALTPLTPLASAPIRTAQQAGGSAEAAARQYREAAQVLGVELVPSTGDDTKGGKGGKNGKGGKGRDGAEAVPEPTKPGTTPAEPEQAVPAPQPGDATTPVDSEPTEPAEQPIEPTEGGEAATPEDTPAPAETPAPAKPPAPALTAEELADLTCADDQGLVDDEADDADAYDLCVAEELGLPAPAGAADAGGALPASTEPDA